MKEKSDYTIDNQRRDCLSIYCKECKKLYNKEFRVSRPEVIKRNNKKWYRGHVEESAIKHKIYYRKNKDKIIAYSAKYLKEHPESGRKSRKKYYKNNIEKIKAYGKKYYAENTERLRANGRAYNKRYYAENSEEICRKAREKYRKKV